MLLERPCRRKLSYAWSGRSSGTLAPGSENDMGTRAAVTLYVALMVAVIVAVDLLFFRNRFWERLTVNVGIVLVVAAFYLRFLNVRP